MASDRGESPGAGDSRHWTCDVVIRAGDFDDLDHLGNAAIARLMDDARTAWWRSLEGRHPDKQMVVRHLSISYEAECRRGAHLRCAVRAVSRTQRSVLVAQTLFDSGQGAVIATAETVHVCFDLPSRSVEAAWPALLAGIQKRQGAPLPLVERDSR
jgi:acyl-CoA thioesterase FadM